MLNAIMSRRLMLAQQAGEKRWSAFSPIPARLEDVADFVAGRVDVARMLELLWGLMLVQPTEKSHEIFGSRVKSDSCPNALYALMKLCFAGGTLRAGAAEVDVTLMPAIHRHAAHGDALRASQQASRRLRASGLTPRLEHLHAPPELSQRAAAALLFPLDSSGIHRLKCQILKIKTQ